MIEEIKNVILVSTQMDRVAKQQDKEDKKVKVQQEKLTVKVQQLTQQESNAVRDMGNSSAVSELVEAEKFPKTYMKLHWKQGPKKQTFKDPQLGNSVDQEC